MLDISSLTAQTDEEEILNDVSLTIEDSENVLLMGPNGSGKTTLVRAIWGDDKVEVKSGEIDFNGKDLLGMKPYRRAQLGIFFGFQYPVEVPGVDFHELLYISYNEIHPEKAEKYSIEDFFAYVDDIADKLSIPVGLLRKGVNEDMSGGERKKMELLQMVVLDPQLVLLDEPDSGLDADSISIVGDALNMLKSNVSVLVISHSAVRLENVGFDSVHVIRSGEIVESGGDELIDFIEEKGYGEF